MTFLNSWAFGFLALAPVIVLLYLLKVRRRTTPVSTLLFWQRILVQNRHRALFQRLRNLLSLLLHLLIFSLLLLALLRPEWSRYVQRGASTVLILDSRARMQAREPDGETRFAKAIHELKQRARHVGSGNEIALLTFSGGVRVAAPFTDDEKTLQEVASRLQPSDAGGDLLDAVHFADQLLASRNGGKRIVIIGGSDLPETLSTKVPVERTMPGSPQDNIAITHFAARPLLNSSDTIEVFFEVQNFGGSQARGNVEFRCDDLLLDVKPFDLTPGSKSTRTFTFVARTNAASRGLLLAKLDSHDPLPVDDQAYATIPVQSPKRVLLVTRGNWFLEKVLEADEAVHWELLAPENFDGQTAGDFDAVVLDSALPEKFDIELARGNYLCLKQTPFNVAGEIAQPLVTDEDKKSPLLRLVSFQNVTFLRTAMLEIPAQSPAWHFDSPLRSFEHPLIIAGERRHDDGTTQRIAAFGFDFAETDMPLRIAFPLLMRNTLQWLAGEEPEPIRATRAGETLMLAPDETVTGGPLPDFATATTTNPTAVRSAFTPLRNGWYPTRQRDRSSWIAVNTFDERESNLRAHATPAVPAGRTLVPLTIWSRWPLWIDCAFAAFLLFALEWWLFHRRRTE